jgi:ssDNA-binding Zn-finger/Zn-ribbon topoisomerase 1
VEANLVSAVGARSNGLWRVIYVGILLLFYVALSACIVTAPSGSGPVHTRLPSEDGDIAIKVFDRVTKKPLLKDAIVHVIATQEGNRIYEVDDDDNERLAIYACASNQFISVWVPGYYISSDQCQIDKTGYEISLIPIAVNNAPGYAWIAADIGAQSCRGCHSGSPGRTEFTEWMSDGHSTAFVDPFFWTMYLGTDINRQRGEETEWKILESGQRVRLARKPSGADRGPGYKLDYPSNFGNCGYCHMPAAVNGSQQEVDLAARMNILPGKAMNVETEGVTCDVCHKVTDVILGNNELPFPDRPGILSFSLLLPEPGQTHYIGPLADHSAGSSIKLTCSPVFGESKFCAACHYGVFGDVVIYNSYGEWLDSSYSEKYTRATDGQITGENKNYRSCQDCHMASSQPVDGTPLEARGACSPANHSFRDFSHNMMKRDNTNSAILVAQAASVTVDAIKENGNVKVNVRVINTGAGHKLPTDSPLRHLILVVEARDEDDRLLTQVEGPTIPAWGGSGNQPEDYAGRPGVIYANILKDRDTNEVPALAYWNPTVPAWNGSDTRLVPNQAVLSTYSFVAPSHGEARINARLYYRYAFIDLIRQKGLLPKDILVNWDYKQIP